MKKSLLTFGYTLFGTKGIPGVDPRRYDVLRGAPFQTLSKMLRVRSGVLANTVLLCLSGQFANFH
jgi:hypothetical protein